MTELWPRDSGRYSFSQRVSPRGCLRTPTSTHVEGDGLPAQPLTLTSSPVPRNSSGSVKHHVLVKEKLSLEVETSMEPEEVSVSEPRAVFLARRGSGSFSHLRDNNDPGVVGW